MAWWPEPRSDVAHDGDDIGHGPTAGASLAPTPAAAALGALSGFAPHACRTVPTSTLETVASLKRYQCI